MKAEKKESKIYIRTGQTDMRKGIDGISKVVAETLGGELLHDEEAQFLFCGRKKDRYKILRWEGDGFTLSYKRLDAGRVQWPKNEEDGEMQSIDERQLRWLLEGLCIHQPRAVVKSAGGCVI
jgi:transposase